MVSDTLIDGVWHHLISCLTPLLSSASGLVSSH